MEEAAGLWLLSASSCWLKGKIDLPLCSPGTHLWHPDGEGLEIARFCPPHLWSSNYHEKVFFQHPHPHWTQHLWGVERRWTTSRKGGIAIHSWMEWAEIHVCRQRQLLSSGNFADSMSVGHDVTGTLAWPEQHGVQGSWSVHPDWKDFFSCCSATCPFSPPVWVIIVKPCSSFQK